MRSAVDRVVTRLAACRIKVRMVVRRYGYYDTSVPWNIPDISIFKALNKYEPPHLVSRPHLQHAGDIPDTRPQTNAALLPNLARYIPYDRVGSNRPVARGISLNV